VSVVAVVLDAADRTLLWRWAREGELPVLARMLADGSSAALESPAGVIPEAAWVTLTTASDPGSHGVYNWRPIRPGTYRRTRQPPQACRKTFWDLLRDLLPDARAVVLDPPFTMPLGDDRVTEIVGWGERGAVRHASWPPDLYDDLERRYEPFPRWTEEDYVRRPREERRLVAALEEAIEARATILVELLERSPWDVAFACFYELHNGGHALFRAFAPESPAHDPRRAAAGRDGLLRLYRAVDRALGRIRDALPRDADLLVCSAKGFRPNTNGESVVTQVMEGLGYQVPRSVSGRSRGIEAARGLVRALAPRPLRRRVFGRLSSDERDRILETLWLESVDWSRSRAFAEPDLGTSFIHLNVRGRQPDGVVEPGAEADALAAEITDEFRRLTHPATGAPAVARVIPREELAPGPNSHLFPDLTVEWTPHVLLDAVQHPGLGVVRERTKDLPTSEHTGDAFAIGVGPAFRRGATGGGGVRDIAATVLHLAGAPLPRDMEGEPLASLLDPSVGPAERVDVDWALDPWRLSRPEP
jgi:predicted AlkP superfamily phosphohydrolase/phosphomutase